MKFKVLVVASIVALSFAKTALADLIKAPTDLSEAPKVFQSGPWVVLRSFDSFSGEVDCTGIYGENHRIRLGKNVLYIAFSSGIESYQLRFDDTKPTNFRPPNRPERGLDAVVIRGKAFQRVLNHDRLRVRAYTLFNGIQGYDIDLTGLDDALSNISAECPLLAEG